MKAYIVIGFLLLMLPSVTTAQSATQALAALARITCTRGGEPQPSGSGFVVGIEGDLATIVTASHVIEGTRCEAEFTTSVSRVPVERVVGIEAGERHGLAALWVRGAPAGVEVLELDAETPVDLGEPLLLAGFSQMASRPRVMQGVFSGPDGKLLLVDRPAGEGSSGGPVLRGGKAVGVITGGGIGEEYTSAVNALVAKEILTGWAIRLGVTLTPLAELRELVRKLEAELDHRSGIDPAPCLPRENKSTYSLFQIEIHDNYARILKKWPSSFDSQVRQTPGVNRAIAAGHLEEDMFTKLARPISGYGRRLPNAFGKTCVFYVTFDIQTTSIATFARWKSVIDRYFYTANPGTVTRWITEN